ncbi:YolD-like family protein [Metabacillus herbersteinensis]|uniref:YolD-like family protein n=1 Tax=Metabacillus herbersteinensis TaxID=283816 RepID=A0ABV6GJ49_9BACI
MLRDRKLIKYQPFLIPEHKALLSIVDKEINEHKKKPDLDENKLDEFNELVSYAMSENKELLFTYYKDYNFHLLIGFVHYADPVLLTLRILDKFDSRTDLNLKDIVDIRLN